MSSCEISLSQPQACDAIDCYQLSPGAPVIPIISEPGPVGVLCHVTLPALVRQARPIKNSLFVREDTSTRKTADVLVYLASCLRTMYLETL